ncbi:MAG: enolase C-terminal domain-like protein [Candidatus Hydrogenedentes bacterium]|jgi:L-alanine-DL-glutamate epimerase-like enolase superfamily enzyme|nr:enolase C-terminal domain-like protein [Candidatus Hydrogenedentota bacterium]
MKIKDVICDVYTWERPTPKVVSPEYPYPIGKAPLDILRIIADDGTEGLFFRTDVNLSESNVADIKRLLIGRDPLDREWSWQRLWGLARRKIRRDGYMKVLAAVDMALWDLAGKAFGVPVYKLMGAYRDKIKVYASSSTGDIQACQEQVVACKQHGVTAYKIHPGPKNANETIELCRAVREAADPDMLLMLDNAGSRILTREDALRVGRAIEELDYYWYEEPIPDYDIEGLIMLREKLDIPICAAENVLTGMFDVPQYILRRAVDIVRSDTRLFGGITPCKRVADLCGVFGMQCEIHAATPMCDLANLHVECAIRNCEFHEIFWPLSNKPSTTTNLPLEERPYRLDNEGYLHIPQKPGLGYDIDWDVLGEPVGTL